MKSFFSFLSVFFVFVSPVLAKDIRPEVLSAVSATIQGVYERILEEKSAREVLRDFDSTVIKTSTTGLPYLEYVLSMSEQVQFIIYVRAMAFDEKDPARDEPGYQEFLYPSAGVRIGAYVRGRAGLGPLNLRDVVRVQATRIEALEQESLPFRLFIKPQQSVIVLGQKLKFELLLKNVGEAQRKLKKLDEASTYCSFNGQNWGSKKIVGEGDVIVLPGQSLRKEFSLKPDRSGDFEIYCSYGIGINGLRPSDRVVVRVE